MKTQWTHYGLAILLAGAVLFTPTAVSAQDAKPSAASKVPEGGTRPTPYRGKIQSLDPDSRTLTLTGKSPNRTLIITAQTKVTKDGSAATLNDAKVGDEVGGQLRIFPDGRREAVSLRIGPKPEGSGKGKAADKKAAAN